MNLFKGWHAGEIAGLIVLGILAAVVLFIAAGIALLVIWR